MLTELQIGAKHIIKKTPDTEGGGHTAFLGSPDWSCSPVTNSIIVSPGFGRGESERLWEDRSVLGQSLWRL